jgi:hypothetical protein
MNQDADALLESLLDSLLNDFNHWFKRGQELLASCPDSVMTPDEREAMGVRIDEGLRAITATRALECHSGGDGHLDGVDDSLASACDRGLGSRSPGFGGEGEELALGALTKLLQIF